MLLLAFENGGARAVHMGAIESLANANALVNAGYDAFMTMATIMIQLVAPHGLRGRITSIYI